MVNPLGLTEGDERLRPPQANPCQCDVLFPLPSLSLVFRPPCKDPPQLWPRGGVRGRGRKARDRVRVWVSHLDPSLLLFIVLLGPWCPGLPLKPEQLLSADPPRKTLLEGFTDASQSHCREDEL